MTQPTNNTRPNTCPNPFLESDGYCTLCGRYHFTINFGKVQHHPEGKPNIDKGYIPPFGGGILRGEHNYDSTDYEQWQANPYRKDK